MCIPAHTRHIARPCQRRLIQVDDIAPPRNRHLQCVCHSLNQPNCLDRELCCAPSYNVRCAEVHGCCHIVGVRPAVNFATRVLDADSEGKAQQGERQPDGIAREKGLC